MTKKTQANSKTKDKFINGKIVKSDDKELLDVKQQYKDISKIFDDWDTEKRYALKEELDDKNGNKTKVLILKTDQSHFIEMYANTGQPFVIGHDGKPIEDSEKLMDWLKFAVNIELTSDNMKLIGTPLLKARQALSDFLQVWSLLVQSEALMDE